MRLDSAEQFLCGRKSPPAEDQITREIEYFLSFYSGISPAMFISYEREAYFGYEDGSMRITFDRNIKWRNHDVSMQSGCDDIAELSPGQVLMEIKIPGAMPIWLADALCELEIFPVSYSKYGAAYTRIMSANKFTPGLRKDA